MALRVVFADDNFLVREGVTALMAEIPDIELVESVADPQSLLKAVKEHAPDAVLTDIRMPPTHTMEGIEAAKQIRASNPSIGVVVLSQYVEEEYAFELLENGVSGLGYLLKERISDIDELVRALQEVSRGGSALDPKVVEGLMMRKANEAEVAAARPDREGARGAGGDGHRSQQRHHRQVALHERARGREAHRLGLPEARPRRRGRDEPPRDGGAQVRRGHQPEPRPQSAAGGGLAPPCVGGQGPARSVLIRGQTAGMTVLPRWLRTTRDLRVGGLVLAGLALFIAVVTSSSCSAAALLIGETDQANIWLSVLATLIVALGSEPLGDWLDTKVTRLVYAGRPSPYEVLRGFTTTVAGIDNPDEVPGRMAQVLAEGTGAEWTQVWLLVDGEPQLAAMWPPDAPGVDQGRQARSSSPGDARHRSCWPARRSACCASRSPTASPLTPVEERLFAGLAAQAGPGGARRPAARRAVQPGGRAEPPRRGAAAFASAARRRLRRRASSARTRHP